MRRIRIVAAVMVVAVSATVCTPVDDDELAGPVTTVTEPDAPILVTPDIDSPASTETTAEALRSFRMAFTGDFLLHRRVNAVAADHASDSDDRSFDYRPMLAHLQPWLADVDWAVGQLEVNLSADGTRLSSYPLFRGPGQLAFDAAELGYDAFTTANNHTLDKGIDGVAETLGVLDAAGLHAVGTARTEAEASSQPYVEIGGVLVAHRAYTYGFNGIPLPPDVGWTSNLIDEERILQDAAESRARGAEFVVVALHWGAEYQHSPSDQQQDLASRLLASPHVDLVVGSHAHVVQPIDRIGGEWAIYGMGNLLSNQSQPSRRDGLLILVTVEELPSGRFGTDLEVVALHLDHRTLTVYPTNTAHRPTGLSPGLEEELDASRSRVESVLSVGTGWDDLLFS